MPSIVENLRKKIQKSIGDESRSYAIAISALQKQWKLKKWTTEMTKKGENYAQKLRNRIKKD